MGIMDILGMGKPSKDGSAACKQCGRACKCKTSEENRPVRLVPDGEYSYRVVYADEPAEAKKAEVARAIR
ncbi:MAG TPA: hypothetical protein VND15_04305 [Candidatus Acidoferrales bacterium]|nr:hypothetical protein [Candidatus Acidoferrales bacterium]